MKTLSAFIVACLFAMTGMRSTSSVILSIENRGNGDYAVTMHDVSGYSVAAYQVFLTFSGMTCDSVTYATGHFDLPLLNPPNISNARGRIVAASGIDVFNGQQPTADDCDLVLLHFTGSGTLDWNTGVHPSTLLSDLGGNPPDEMILN